MGKDISYRIVDGYDEVIAEHGNEMLALRKIMWGENLNGKVYLDLRRWKAGDTGEIVGKGFSFFDPDNTPHELVHRMVELGYGDTKTILGHLSGRNNFGSSMVDILGSTLTEEQIERFKQNAIEEIDPSEELYDPRSDLGLDDDFE
jgi:hypothetical protein